MLIVDRVVLDPEEFKPGGAPLDLAGDGYRVIEADFGEADLEMQFARAQMGELPTDWHPQNATTTLKLEVVPEGEIDIPTALYKLQQKVGELNTPGHEGWLRRDFDVSPAGGTFKGSLGRRIYKAMLSPVAGWQKGEAPEITLQFVTSPYWYADEEIEAGSFSTTTSRELIWEVSEMLGTAPGLIRVKVTNNNTGEEHWRALIGAIECRDHPQDATASTTAALAYECEALTPKGGAKIVERAGASGGKVVEHAELTAGWLTILDSEIAEVGPMTHKGVRRVRMRIYDPGSEAGNVQLRMRWRPLGTLAWDESNKVVSTPLVGNFADIDLGEVRLQQPTIGKPRWGFQVAARALSGSGEIRLDRVRVWPTEQMAVLTAPGAARAPEAQAHAMPSSAENGEGSGGQWQEPSKATASDNQYAIAQTAEVKTPVSMYLTRPLKMNFTGLAIPEEAAITGIVWEVKRFASHLGTEDFDVSLYGESGFLGSHTAFGQWPLANQIAVYGGSSDKWGAGSKLTPTEVNNGLTVSLSVKGTVIGATANVDFSRITIYYTEAEDPNRVCFATRSVEMRNDGFYRQDASEDVWGRLVPEGFNFEAPASGLEKRKVRGMLMPSQGDLGELADSGTNKLGAVVKYRPAYLFAREARPTS